jgi:hypothetical protein
LIRIEVLLTLSMLTDPLRPPPVQVTFHLVVAMMGNWPEEVMREGQVYLCPQLGEAMSP